MQLSCIAGKKSREQDAGNAEKLVTKMMGMVILMAFLQPDGLAAEKMKAGLWEVTMKSDEMSKMPKVPPDQLEQMRSMGIHVPEEQAEGVTTKICITQEMAESERLPTAPNESDCKTKNFRRTGDVYTVDVICKGPNINGTGKVNGRLLSGEHFISTYRFAGTAHGKSFRQEHERKGRWLGADCGNVKPTEQTWKN